MSKKSSAGALTFGQQVRFIEKKSTRPCREKFFPTGECGKTLGKISKEDRISMFLKLNERYSSIHHSFFHI